MASYDQYDPNDPNYDPMNPNPTSVPDPNIVTTQPVGTPTLATTGNLTAHTNIPTTHVPPSSSTTTPPPSPTPPSPTGGGNTNVPGLYGSIFNGLPTAPSTQIDLSSINGSDPYSQALQQAIMAAIQQNQQPVTANDPLIAPVISSLQGQAQRAMDQNAQQVAEQMYAQGLPVSGGGYDSRVLGYNQLTNEATQGNIANTMLSQLNDRQNRLMTALNLGSTYLTSEQSRILQGELANVQNAMAMYGMQSNTSLGLLSQLLGNAQFYNQLGTQANEFTAGQNANATGSLL